MSGCRPLGLLLILICLCLICATASAADIPITVTMAVTPGVFSEPAEAEVSIKVSNSSDQTLPGPVTLTYPNGRQVPDFEPVLEPGASKTWTGTWSVTQAQLDAGVITFRISYSMYDDDGSVVKRTSNMHKNITYEGQVAMIEVNRSIMPTAAGKDQNVSVTYDVINTGNVTVTDVSILENSSIATQRASLGSIAPGEKATHTFTVKMGTKDLTSAATITYKAGGQTQTVTHEAATIRYHETNLSVKLVADKKGGLTGESVKLTLTLSNTGKDDIDNLNVTDAILGDVFSGIHVGANETRTYETTVPIEQTADYQFIITGTDSAGGVIEAASDRVTVTAIEPGQVINLEVFITADNEALYTLPSTVRFTTSVTNRSAIDVTNVSVITGDNTLYTFPTIAAGETRTFIRDAQVNMGGRFQFTARVRNQLGEEQTFDSNVLQLSYTAPTPVPTDAPLVTPPAPQLESIPQAADLPAWYDQAGHALNWAAIVLAVLAAIGVLLLIISAISRLIHRKDHVEPMDSLEPIELLQNMPASDHLTDDDLTNDASDESTVEAVEAASRHRRVNTHSVETPSTTTDET